MYRSAFDFSLLISKFPPIASAITPIGGDAIDGRIRLGFLYHTAIMLSGRISGADDAFSRRWREVLI